MLILPFVFRLLLSIITYFPFQFLYAYPDGWSDDILVNEDTSDNQYRPDVSTDTQNNVWITWHVATLTEGEIYYSKRDSVGNCLLPETTVSNNASKSWKARVAVDASDNAHIVWRDESPQGFGIWYAKLANDGTEIVPPKLAVSGAGDLLCSLEPEIALNKYKEVNVAWDERPLENQMDYSKLDSLGDTLIAKIQITPDYLAASWVGIGVDSFANNHMACRTDTTGTSDRLTYSKLDKDGNILISNKVLATGGNNAIVSDKHQNIHIVYTNPAGPGNRIDYLKLDNDGNILIGPKQISLPQISSNTYSHMAIDSLQYLHIVWQADSSGWAVNIMYAKMDTAGNFIIPPMKVVYPYPQGGREPRIAVDHSNRLHLVWTSTRLGSEDIFYKRGENETGVKETAQSNAAIPKLSVFPNPFTQMTNIRFGIEHGAKGTALKIYDVTGRLVRDFLINQLMPYTSTHAQSGGANSPINHITWNGDDASGNSLPSGVYFIQISNFGNNQSIPVILLK